MSTVFGIRRGTHDKDNKIMDGSDLAYFSSYVQLF